MPIRLIAWGLLVQSGRVLVQSRVGESFYRLPGGGIEEGETASEALARELAEEYRLEAEIGDLCSTVESTFESDGGYRQQVVLVHRFSVERSFDLLRHREHDDIVLAFQDLATLSSSSTAPPELHAFAVEPPTHLVVGHRRRG